MEKRQDIFGSTTAIRQGVKFEKASGVVKAGERESLDQTARVAR